MNKICPRKIAYRVLRSWSEGVLAKTQGKARHKGQDSCILMVLFLMFIKLIMMVVMLFISIILIMLIIMIILIILIM